MPKDTISVKFTATKHLPTFLYRKGGAYKRPYNGGETISLRGPITLKDGDTQEMTTAEYAWCRTMYPDNFKANKPVKKVAATVEIDVEPESNEDE